MAVRHTPVRTGVLILAMMASLMGLAFVEAGRVEVRHAAYPKQVEAANLMAQSMAALARHREALGIPIDIAEDPNKTGLIGLEFTEITTSLGAIEAKRTSTNPAFAALMVRYFHDLGLGEGDAVAVGASGSFPALILATLCAAKAYGVNPIVIYSVGSSTHGANIPEFTFIEILDHLRDIGMLPYSLAAISLGGDGDHGDGSVFGWGRDMFRAIAERSGAPLIFEPDLEASIRRRLEVYEEASPVGRPIRCFINIGGASPDFGATLASLEFPNGLVRQGPILTTSRERGLIFEFASMGVPVIHLLNIRGLAAKAGIPIDPVPFPPIGQGQVYMDTTRPKGRAAAALAVFIAILIIPHLTASRSPRPSPH